MKESELELELVSGWLAGWLIVLCVTKAKHVCQPKQVWTINSWRWWKVYQFAVESVLPNGDGRLDYFQIYGFRHTRDKMRPHSAVFPLLLNLLMKLNWRTAAHDDAEIINNSTTSDF